MTEHRKTRRAAHPLGLEDRILWNKVARTVNPLDRARHRAAQQDVWEDWVAEAFADGVAAPRNPPAPLAATVPRPATGSPEGKGAPGARAAAPGLASLERPAWRKLARGRVLIDASIDLHHMNQDEAMSRLHRFLVQARARQCRHVLVITGKGRSPRSEGVLRRMLPVWLGREPFSSLVSGVRAAGRGHGGEGAFYVRLRKPVEPRQARRHGHGGGP